MKKGYDKSNHEGEKSNQTRRSDEDPLASDESFSFQNEAIDVNSSGLEPKSEENGKERKICRCCKCGKAIRNVRGIDNAACLKLIGNKEHQAMANVNPIGTSKNLEPIKSRRTCMCKKKLCKHSVKENSQLQLAVENNQPGLSNKTNQDHNQKRLDHSKSSKIQITSLTRTQDHSVKSCRCLANGEERKQNTQRTAESPLLSNTSTLTNPLDAKKSYSRIQSSKFSIAAISKNVVQEDGKKCQCRCCSNDIKPKLKHQPVIIKSFDLPHLFQHPRIPSSTIKSSISAINLLHERPQNDVRTRTSSATNLLGRPRIRAGYSGKEDKRIHTFDCSCMICQDPSVQKHPVENEKKQKWKLPWNPKHPVELKPKPLPIEMKPWKVADIFRHPRIPLKEPVEIVRPLLSSEPCTCHEIIPGPYKVSRKQNSATKLLQKPRVTPNVSKTSLEGKICECSTCKNQSNTFGHRKPTGVHVQLKPTLQSVRVPINTISQNQFKHLSANVSTKPMSTAYFFQHPRLLLYSQIHSTLYKSDQECICATNERLECPVLGTDQEGNEGSLDFMPHNVRTKPSIVSNLLQHPRILHAIDDNPAKTQSVPGSSEACSCSDMLLKRKTDGGCSPSLICLQRTSKHSSTDSECSNLNFAVSLPSKYEDGAQTKAKSIHMLFRRPRVPQYTQHPIVCDFGHSFEDNSEYRRPAGQEAALKILPFNAAMQHPRVPNAISTRPHIQECGNSNGVYDEVCPCSDNSAWRKTRVDVLKPCQPIIERHRVDTERRSTHANSIVGFKKTNLVQLFQQPRIPLSIQHSRTRIPPHKLSEVRLELPEMSSLLQHPRVQSTVHCTFSESSTTIHPFNECPCTCPSQTTSCEHLMNNLIAFLRTSRNLRISSPNNYNLKRTLSESLQKKTFISSNLFQRPRIDQLVAQFKQFGDTGRTSWSVLTKPKDIDGLFQHPRVLLREAPQTQSKKICDCTLCQNGQPCRKSQLKEPQTVDIKPFNISAIIQRPRIPTHIDTTPAKAPQDDSAPADACPCTTQIAKTISLSFLQHPKIPQPIDNTERLLAGGTSNIVLTKSKDIAGFFQHPRILHNKEAKTRLLKLKPWPVFDVFQQPRISGSSMKRWYNKSAIADPSVKHNRADLGECCQMPRISRQIDVELGSHVKAAGINATTSTKTPQLVNTLQQPRVPKAIHITSVNKKPCVCERCRNSQTKGCNVSMLSDANIVPSCSPKIDHGNQGFELCIVKTKHPPWYNVFQHPRVPNVFRKKAHSKKICHCNRCHDRKVCEGIRVKDEEPKPYAFGDKQYEVLPIETKRSTAGQDFLLPGKVQQIEGKQRKDGQMVSSKLETKQCTCSVCADTTHSCSELKNPAISCIKNKLGDRKTSCACNDCRVGSTCKNKSPRKNPRQGLPSPIAKHKPEVSPNGSKTQLCVCCECYNAEAMASMEEKPVSQVPVKVIELQDSLDSQTEAYRNSCGCTICRKAYCQKKQQSTSKEIKDEVCRTHKFDAMGSYLVGHHRDCHCSDCGNRIKCGRDHSSNARTSCQSRNKEHPPIDEVNAARNPGKAKRRSKCKCKDCKSTSCHAEKKMQLEQSRDNKADTSDGKFNIAAHNSPKSEKSTKNTSERQTEGFSHSEKYATTAGHASSSSAVNQTTNLENLSSENHVRDRGVLDAEGCRKKNCSCTLCHKQKKGKKRKWWFR